MTGMASLINNLLIPPFDRLRVNGGGVLMPVKPAAPFVLSLSKHGYTTGFKASCAGHESP